MAFKKFTIYENLNLTTYQDYYDRLSLLAVSLFEWSNLPIGVNERFLEKKLYEDGRMLFFNDLDFGLMALRCTPSGELNFYEEPINYTAFALNYNKVYDRSQSVLIRDNLLELPIRFTIEQFAYRLANAERTIDVNINSQKTPVMIQGSDKQMLSLKTLYSQYEGNTPVLFADKDLNRENLKVFKTDSPYVADKLQNYKHQIYNEALTFLGIDNANTDKKERLITDEVESNNHNLSMSLQSRLLTRKMACKEINEKYDLNIDVNVRENLFPTIKKEGITKNE